MTTAHRRHARPHRGRSARLGLRQPARRAAPDSPIPAPLPAARRLRGADLLANATAVVVLVAGRVISISISIGEDTTVSGIDPAYASYAVTAMALATNGLFRWLAAGIRPPRRDPAPDRASLSAARPTVQP